MPPPVDDAERPRLGCIASLLAVAGLFAGGMIAVAAGWVVTKATGCTPPQGFPICNIHRYWVPGMLIGMLTLPGIVIWRLRQSAATTHNGRS